MADVIQADNIASWAKMASMGDFELVLAGIAGELRRRRYLWAAIHLDEALLRLGRIRRNLPWPASPDTLVVQERAFWQRLEDCSCGWHPQPGAIIPCEDPRVGPFFCPECFRQLRIRANEQGGAWAEFLALLAALAGLVGWGAVALLAGRF